MSESILRVKSMITPTFYINFRQGAGGQSGIERFQILHMFHHFETTSPQSPTG